MGADNMSMSNMDSIAIKGFRNKKLTWRKSRTSVPAAMAKVNEDGPFQMQERKSERMTSRRSSAKRGSDFSNFSDQNSDRRCCDVDEDYRQPSGRARRMSRLTKPTFVSNYSEVSVDTERLTKEDIVKLSNQVCQIGTQLAEELEAPQNGTADAAHRKRLKRFIKLRDNIRQGLRAIEQVEHSARFLDHGADVKILVADQ